MPIRSRAALLLVPLLLGGLTACADAAGGTALDRAQNGFASSTTVGTTDDGLLTAADGYLPDGAGVSATDDVPAVTDLDPELRAAVQEAARAAAADGVVLRITSGWRSAELQQALFDAAVAEHGSVDAARAYVLQPDESEHVTGDAVDVGPTEAMYWLARHGSDWGLCQTYGNEAWHYELATEPGTACPPPLTDARAG
ncbi:M15 family metallopeptidase [Blastococcus sp. URHD0036]|uniref:M15 family metallopeptidase n=1 Tax=Blastococcus sp. URHD0036 TaxID=1380356 RepID=UPI00068A50FF|nr:M15 family metallopeptidase [Blastococcus sp. URHD0036]